MLRWVLLVPLAIYAWYGIFALGLYTNVYVERNFCPPEDVVSGFCHNNEIQMWLKIIRHASVFLSAVAVVLVAAVVAPSNRKRVAWLSFLVGAITAMYMSLKTASISLLLSALVGGIVGVLLIVWRVSKNPPNKALNN